MPAGRGTTAACSNDIPRYSTTSSQPAIRNAVDTNPSRASTCSARRSRSNRPAEGVRVAQRRNRGTRRARARRPRPRGPAPRRPTPGSRRTSTSAPSSTSARSRAARYAHEVGRQLGGPRRRVEGSSPGRRLPNQVAAVPRSATSRDSVSARCVRIGDDVEVAADTFDRVAESWRDLGGRGQGRLVHELEAGDVFEREVPRTRPASSNAMTSTLNVAISARTPTTRSGVRVTSRSRQALPATRCSSRPGWKWESRHHRGVVLVAHRGRPDGRPTPRAIASTVASNRAACWWITLRV